MFTSEEAQKAQKLYKQTLLRLGEMLKVLKQGDNSRNRELLRGHCDYLSAQGKKQNLFGWVDLMETAKVAIVKSENDYQSTTKLIIKEIKNANECLIKNEINAIYPSDELQHLAPQAKSRLMDVQTVFIEERPEIEIEPEPKKTKTTLDRDLWDETIHKEYPSGAQQQTETSDSDISYADIQPENDLLEELLNDNLDDRAVFVNEQDTITNDSETVEQDEFTNLFEDQEGEELQIDQWNDDEVEELDTIFDEEIESTSAKEADDSFSEDLSELLGEESIISSVNPRIDYQATIVSGENFDVNDLDDLFTETERSTVFIDDPLSELEGAIDNLDDLDIEDDFPSTGTVDTFQILKPDKSEDHKIVFYDEFEELENIITSVVSSSAINLLFNQLEKIIDNDAYNYYEDNSELDKLVNSLSLYQEQVNWHELDHIVGNIDNTDFLSSDTTLVSVSPSAFNELDQLLAQAGKVQNKSPQWKLNNIQQTKNNNQVRVFEQSMRVPVKQLDNLNNLIGEIVVRRNRLEEDQGRLRQFLDNLLGQVQNLSDVSTRMQDLYERSLLEGSLIDSRRRNEAVVKAQLARGIGKTTFGGKDNDTSISQENEPPQLDELELDRFTGFHLLSQEIIELIVKVKESSSDIQFLVDETDQLGRNLREITTQLQEGINKSRMVPFSQNADRLPLPIRKIAQGYDKQVNLQLEGREVLIDKMILEHIWDPLLQITKNSVTHGIELPAEREALGKPPQGTITVRAFLQGQQTVISVSDDGGGIDPQVIKRKAIEKHLVTPKEAQKLKPQEIYDFLFNAGFTTKETADSHAGRGVGLDIVRSKLNEIRGIVSIDSTPGQGSTFTIRLPLTVTVGKALCCLNDNTRIAFPMDAIEDTKDFSAKEIKVNAQGQKCITWNNELLPFRPLSTLLKYNRQVTRSIVYTSNTEQETIPIIILRGGNNLLAIQVDQVLGQEEIVIKQISGPLPKPKGISGATVRSDGIVMPIGDVIELIEIAQGNITLDVNRHLSNALNRGSALLESSTNNQPLVLIVDDSITVREMLSITFSKSGYRVEQARDGQEAWQKLRSGLPCDLVFCDIEMPRMNGLELLEQMQQEDELRDIPMAILSSRGAEKHQRIAAELGASAYLVKPYVEKDLIDSAKRMINGEVLLSGSTKKPKKVISAQPDNSIVQKNSQAEGGNKSKTSQMVLIIDDSVVVREMLSMTFKKAGYQVEQARDGQDAWDKVSGGLPCDLLLCDIEMPRMNGLELLAKMQKDEHLSRLPVAMVTSRGAEKHRKIAADLGAKAYFTKPYLEEELLTAAKSLIAGETLL